MYNRNHLIVLMAQKPPLRKQTNNKRGWAWWLLPVVLATWKTEVEGR